MRVIASFCLILGLLFWCDIAQARSLADRLAEFPQWQTKPPVIASQSDLVYPDWMAGTWNVTSTLVDLVAPLAPDIVTPGFENNRRHLNQPINFQVRFVNQIHPSSDRLNFPLESLKMIHQAANKSPGIIADRVFNGLNIGKAYLGDRAVLSVKVDPKSPSRQITSLQGGKQLVSIVTGRKSEFYSNKFIATELYQQIFRSPSQIYFNTVETTTAYKYVTSPTVGIAGDQVTAIYLSPQDSNYFKTGDRPVALYRYRLELLPINP